MRGLIIVDYSNDFVHPDGALTAGEPAQQLDEYIATLAQEFIDNGDYVVFANDLHHEGDPYHPETQLFPPHNLEGTWGRELYGKLSQVYEANKDQSNVYWTDKRRYSAFVGTEIDVRFRERGIREVWIVGVVTDICILHTAMSAYNLGYHAVIPRAGVASFNQVGHEWALEHFTNTLNFEVR